MVNWNFLFVGARVVQDRHACNPLSIALRTYHCAVLVYPQIGGEESAREAALSQFLIKNACKLAGKANNTTCKP